MSTLRKPAAKIPQAAPESASSRLKPIPSLLKSRDITRLWMVRMLVRLGAADDFLAESKRLGLGRRASVIRSLGMPYIGRESCEREARGVIQRLELTLKLMEERVRQYTWSRTIQANLCLLDETFSLSSAEKTIFVLAAWLRTDDDFLKVAECCMSQVNVTDQLHRIIALPTEQIRRAVSPQSTLRRSGLVTVSSGGPLAMNLDLQRGHLRCLVTTRLKSIEQLFNGILCIAHPPTLSPLDYPHLKPSFDFISSVVKEALNSGRRGVNILLYGPPGTGKTELTRIVAQHASVPLYDVSCVNEDGLPADARTRLSSASTAQYLGSLSIRVVDFQAPIGSAGWSHGFFGKCLSLAQTR